MPNLPTISFAIPMPPNRVRSVPRAESDSDARRDSLMSYNRVPRLGAFMEFPRDTQRLETDRDPSNASFDVSDAMRRDGPHTP